MGGLHGCAAALTLALAGGVAAQAVSSADTAQVISQPTSQAVSPPTAPPVAAEVPSAEMGRRVYTRFCTRCHGINLAVGSSAFFDLRTFPPDDKERFLRSVKGGVRVMPAWDGIVKPHEMEAIWLYIGSVNGWPAPK